MDFQVELSHALGLERPVYIGCSIGGFLAPDLALERPDEFRAVIGVESAMKAGLYTHSSLFGNPRIGNEFKYARILNFAGPTSPEKYVHESCLGGQPMCSSCF